MIDVYAAIKTFPDTAQLGQDVAARSLGKGGSSKLRNATHDRIVKVSGRRLGVS